VDREITLRDYGRVLWSGRWLILTTTLVAAFVGLVLTFVTTTSYTATAELFLGQATTVSGTPVSTPGTNPSTAPTVLTGDQLVARVAREIGVSPSRVRKGVELTAPRAPGGSVGNQPTVATIHFTDSSKEIARRGANAYAQAVLDSARESFSQIAETYESAVAAAQADVDRLNRDIDAYRRELAASPSSERALTLQSLLFSANTQLSIAQTELSEQQLNLAKERQIGQPDIVSLATSTKSSSSLPNRARTVILAAIIGLLVGIVVTFIWKGSPAGRAGRE
jgi:uncharacterized protein involved in exopolysaccharide biosynthesis